MTRRLAERARLSAGILAVAFAVTACGSSAATTAPTQAPTAAAVATPAPAATPTATAAPTPEPTVAPTAPPAATPAPTANTSGDPAAGLAVTSPYSLGKVPTGTGSTLKSVLKGSMGATTYAKVHVGLRSVSADGKMIGYVMVVRFDAGTLTQAAYEALLGQMAVNSKVVLTTRTVSGNLISLGKLMGVYLGGYHHGDDAVLVITPASGDLVPILKAIIDANG